MGKITATLRPDRISLEATCGICAEPINGHSPPPAENSATFPAWSKLKLAAVMFGAQSIELTPPNVQPVHASCLNILMKGNKNAR